MRSPRPPLLPLAALWVSSQRSSGEEPPGGPLGLRAAGVAAQQVPGGRLQGLRHQGGASGQVEEHQAALHHVGVAVGLGEQRGTGQDPVL